jgi:ATP-dependent helicase/nuclease subunit A
LVEQIAPTIQTFLAAEQQSLVPALTESLGDLFSAFGRSESYTRLRSATIIGREVPFVIPWEQEQLMQGVIDVIYRLDDRLWIADYKTDAVTAREAPMKAEIYRRQAEIYKTAVQKSLGISSVSFQFLFLRSGVAVVI